MATPWSVRIPAVLAAAGLLLGCGAPPADPPQTAGLEPASMLTELGPGEAEQVAQTLNQFGFDLFGELAAGDQNTVTSPVSAAVLLAMVLAGASGDTAEAMAGALHLSDARDARVRGLLEQLTDTDEVTLSVANGLWADPDIELRDGYTGFVRDTFGAGLEQADLSTTEAADALDGWVAEQTGGRIDAIAAELGLPADDTMLVLLNTVYFLGQWRTAFDPGQTAPQPFTRGDGSVGQVPMMHQLGQELPYASRGGYQLVRLPYGADGRYGMEVLLPEPEVGLAQLLDRLDAAEWQAAVDSLAPRTVDELALPRFELNWGETLNPALERLGMGPAFAAGQADFSPMSPAELYLQKVVQKTYIRVDEAGTEAAAVTGGAVGITSLQPDRLVFRADRPFAFTISDQETGAVLFLGAVADPQG